MLFVALSACTKLYAPFHIPLLLFISDVSSGGENQIPLFSLTAVYVSTQLALVALTLASTLLKSLTSCRVNGSVSCGSCICPWPKTPSPSIISPLCTYNKSSTTTLFCTLSAPVIVSPVTLTYVVLL